MNPSVLASIYFSKKRFRNLVSLLRKNGTFFLNDGTTIRFSRNKYDVALNVLVFSNQYGVKFNNGEWKLDFDNNLIATPSGIRFNLDYFNAGIFNETFLADIHFTGFDLNNKVVVQAGGYIGDTALYYASRGAIVYSFEPEPALYKAAKGNIELNPHLKDKIIMENFAIGEDKIVKFPLDREGLGGSSVFKADKRDAVDVRSLSLKTVLNTYQIDNPYLLDLDIKGYEFKVIDDEVVRKFKIVRIEYTTKIDSVKLGERDYLLKRLQEYGFTKIRVYKHSVAQYDLMDHGTVLAYKSL